MHLFLEGMQYVVKKNSYDSRDKDQKEMQRKREAYITKVKLSGLVKQKIFYGSKIKISFQFISCCMGYFSISVTSVTEAIGCYWPFLRGFIGSSIFREKVPFQKMLCCFKACNSFSMPNAHRAVSHHSSTQILI